MADDDVIETEAQPIDPPAALTEADRWLAEQREKVAARAAEFTAFDVTTPEQYRDAKAQRKALRALISEVDGDKKRMTAQLRDTLSRFNAEVGAILAGLREEDVQYRSEIERWERQVVLDRDARVEGRYRDEYPDLAAQVPYQRLRNRFGAEWKADNYGTKESAVWKGVEAACEAVSSEIASLAAQTHVDGVELDDDDRRDLMADYLRTLDMPAATRACVDRVRQREALRRAEEERREWEEAQSARAREAFAEPAREDAEPEPVRAPDVAREAPQGTPQGPVTAYVYEVTVPAAQLHRFMEAMKSIEGTRGKCVRKVR